MNHLTLITMKKLYTTLVAILAIIQISYGQWTNATNISNTNSGNVSIGTTSSLAKLTVYQGIIVGSAVHNSTLLSSISGATSNTFQNTYDQGNYQVQGMSVVINPRNLNTN